MLCFNQKRRITGEKYIAPMDFGEHLTKLDVSKNSKVHYVPFLRNELHKSCCYIGKSRRDAKYLEV